LSLQHHYSTKPYGAVLGVPCADLTTSNGTNEAKDTTCNSVDQPNNDSACAADRATDELMIVSKPGICLEEGRDILTPVPSLLVKVTSTSRLATSASPSPRTTMDKKFDASDTVQR
jgi:hypothetical protein